jgi:hypothetical protein
VFKRVCVFWRHPHTRASACASVCVGQTNLRGVFNPCVALLNTQNSYIYTTTSRINTIEKHNGLNNNAALTPHTTTHAKKAAAWARGPDTMLVRQRPVPPCARPNAGATASRVLNHICTRTRVLARCQGAPLPVPEVAAPLESDGPAAPAAANIIPAGSLRLRVSSSNSTRAAGDDMVRGAE